MNVRLICLIASKSQQQYTYQLPTLIFSNSRLSTLTGRYNGGVIRQAQVYVTLLITTLITSVFLTQIVEHARQILYQFTNV